MDNLTHSLVGLAAAKAGLERLSPGATALCVVAANAPDGDIITLFVGGRWLYLYHHRGITHSVIGVLIIALVLPLLFYFVDRIQARLRGRIPNVRLSGLVLTSVIVSATHPLMDWANNYGIRPWLPWSSQWYYGDILFIVDPYLWLLLGGAVFLLCAKSKGQILFWSLVGLGVTYLVIVAPSRGGFEGAGVLRIIWLVGLATLIVLHRLGVGKRSGHRVLAGAFLLMLCYLGSLAILQRLALRETEDRAVALSRQTGESIVEVAAMPTLANPFHWQSLIETETASVRFETFLINQRKSGSRFVREQRPIPERSSLVTQAFQDPRAQVFLRFARFPVIRVFDPDCKNQTLVQFADLRYTEPGSSRGAFSLEVPVKCPTEVTSR